MDVYPTKPQICLINASSKDATNNAVHIYDYDQKVNSYKKTKDIQLCTPHALIKYSPNGSLISIANSCSIKMINPVDNYDIYDIDQIPFDDNSRFASIKFHPNSAVLAALIYVTTSQGLTHSKAILRYLDSGSHSSHCNSSKKRIIAEISLADFYHYVAITEQALSFSPDGTKIGIKFHDKFIVLPVPFEVIYHPEAHKKMLLISEILTRYNLPSHDIMPNLLEVFKR